MVRITLWTASGTVTIDQDGPVAMTNEGIYGPASLGTLSVNAAAVVAFRVENAAISAR